MSAEVEGYEPYFPPGQEPPEQQAKPTQVGYFGDEPKPKGMGYFPEEQEVEGYEQYTTPEIEEEKDSRAMNIARTMFQLPLGAAQKFTYGLDLLQMIGAGDALDSEEIDRIAMISEREGIPFDRDKYVEKVYEAMDLFLTQGNVEREIEERTGLPLQPKTKSQKLLRHGSMGGAIQPGSTARKLTAGTATAAATKGTQVGVKKGLKAVGHDEETSERVSEAVAPFVGLPIGVGVGTLAPRVSIKTKPSGLPAYRFEKIKGTTKVTPARKDAIKKTLEKDFRKVAAEIIEESPKAETFKEVLENPTAKAEAAEGFKKLEELAGRINETVHTDRVKYHQLRRRELQKRGTSPTEYDKSYDKYAMEIINKTPAKAFTIAQYVNDYRKNNEALTGYFEPGQSRNVNRARRDALLDHNRAIVDMLEELFPDSEFTKAFKEQNQRWIDINDAEFISEFIDGIFNGEINYRKSKAIIEDKNTAFKFQRFLGKEGFEDLKRLIKDFLKQEPFEKQIEVAESQSMGSAMKEAAAWLIHPAIGSIKTGAKLAKKAWHMLLDKPQLSVDWKAGIDAFKAGRFKEAEEIFEELEETVQAELEIPQPAPTVKTSPKPEVEIDITPNKPKAGTKLLEGPKDKPQAKVKPKPTTPKPTTPGATSSTDISGAFRGSDPMRGLYEGIFESLEKGSDTFAGVKDPLIQRAKPYYEKGLIKSPEDIRTLVNKGPNALKNGPKPKGQPKLLEKIPSELKQQVAKIGETRGEGIQYHGSPTTLEQPSSEHYGELNYYGQGFYTTDAIDIAAGYANRRTKGKKTPSLYRVYEKELANLVDMEKPLQELPKNIQEVLQESRGLEEVDMAFEEDPANMRELYDNIREIGTGEGLSAFEIQDLFSEISDKLEQLGYDGYSHTGGLRTKKTPHTVKIYFDPSKTVGIKSLGKSRYKKQTTTPKTIEIPSKQKLLSAPRKFVALPIKIEPKKLTFKGKGGKYLNEDAKIPYITIKKNILESSSKNEVTKWGKLTKSEILENIPKDTRNLAKHGLYTLKDSQVYKWSNNHPRVKELKKNIIDYVRDPSAINQDYLSDSINQFKDSFDGIETTTSKDLTPNFKLTKKSLDRIIRNEAKNVRKPNPQMKINDIKVRTVPKHADLQFEGLSDSNLYAKVEIDRHFEGKSKKHYKNNQKDIEISLDPEDEVRFYNLIQRDIKPGSKPWKTAENALKRKLAKNLTEGRPLIPVNKPNHYRDYTPAGVLGDYFKDPLLRAKFDKVLDYPVRTQKDHWLIKDDGITYGFYTKGEPITIIEKLTKNPHYRKDNKFTETLIHEATHLLQDIRSRITTKRMRMDYKIRPHEITATQFPEYMQKKRNVVIDPLKPGEMTKREPSYVPEPYSSLTNEKLKGQQKYALDIVDALAQAYPDKKILEVSIPGDGDFYVPNNKRSIDNFKSAVKKYWTK